MRIDRDSWHCKLVREFFNPPKSLCSYFWKFVAACALVVMFVLGGILLSPLLALLFLGHLVWEIRKDRRQRLMATHPERFDPKPPRESSFVMQYVKAKKRKICPLIEYE